MNTLSVQQVMREYLRASIRSGALIAVDVGAYTTRAVIANFVPDRLLEAVQSGRADEVFAALKISGAGMVRSEGARDTDLNRIMASSGSVQAALNQALETAGESINYALITMGGNAVRSYATFGETKLRRGVVETRDIEQALRRCEPPPKLQSRETIHAAPARFLIDGIKVDNPLDVVGKKLQVETHFVTAKRETMRDVLETAKRSGLEAAGLVATPYASGLGCLLANEMERGVACIDLGGETSSIAIFQHGRLCHLDSIPVGGGHISRDIAVAFDVIEIEAERVKTLYGDAVFAEGDDRLITVTLKNGNERRFSRSMLISVIRPRLEETFEMIRQKLSDAGFYEESPPPIVLTGGGAELAGAVEIAQKILGKRVRLGRPVGLAGLPALAARPAFSATIGLLAYAAKVDSELWSGPSLSQLTSRTTTQKAFTWFANNW